MWDADFTFGVGDTRFRVNLPGIHPAKIIATVANANSGPDNYHLSSCAMNDCDPKFPG
jgi:hypothetical protein